MTFIILVFVALIAIGAPDRASFHPATAALLTSQRVESIDCEPAPGPDSVLEAPKPSRTSNFHLLGEYNCRRPIFTSSERNPFIDRVLQAQTESARQVSLSVEKLLHGKVAAPIVVRVEGELDADLRAKVEALYRTELAQVVGASRIAHDRQPTFSSPLLEIQMYQVDDPALMMVARLRLPLREKEGAPVWQNL